MTNNTEVRFLSGTHILNTTVAVINNCYNLTIAGFENTNMSHDNKRKVHPIALIDCKLSIKSGFWFINSREMLIKNIAFDSCGTNLKVKDYEFSVALFFNKGSNLVLHRVVINNTKGYGLHTENVLGSIQISESYFVRSAGINSKPSVGNAKFHFKERCDTIPTTNLMILSSWFMDGKRRSTGLEVMIDTPKVHVEIEDVTIGNNHGGNLILIVKDYESSSYIKIRNCHIDYGKAYEGGGMRFLFRTESSNLSLCTDTTVYKILDIYNTTFHNNTADGTGGAVCMKIYQSGGYDCVLKKVEFSHCSFIKNIGNGAVVDISKHLTLSEHNSPPLNVNFETCKFCNNLAKSKNGHVLNIIMGHISMSNCVFFGSKGTALSLQKSNLNVYNTITFENNHARRGGALKVCEGSFVFLHKNSHIIFINNTAQMGGAIFIQGACVDTSPLCVFQPSLPEVVSIVELHEYLQLDFVNNYASTAGDALYGGSLEICHTIATDKNTSSSFRFVDIIKYSQVFNMENQTGPSWIASDPKRVCFCSINETPQHYSCTKLHPVIEVYPGERFNISAVTVGQLNGVTFGSIHSSLIEETTYHQLVVHDGEKYSNCCIPLNYTLYTNETNAIVNLRPAVEDNYGVDNINVAVHILPCPLGFELAMDSNGLYTCKCSTAFHRHDTEYLKYYNFLQCHINTQTIYVPKYTSVWMHMGCQASNSHLNKTKNQSICDVLLLSQYCNYYCNSSARNVSLFRPDEQCIHGRTGILCGACRPGLSRTLGSYYTCDKCSNKSLLWYISSVVLSGVLIVFLLTALNLTVTEGAINGLVLYATVLFRIHNNANQSDQHHVSAPLWKFIAWLNLDSGNTHSCAYDGLTGYQYIWLNFGYVFYLLLIQVAIILLSRRFIFFTRLIGKNVVKVLATLQLLTYSQLMYAIFHTFHFALVYEFTSNEQSSIRIVWHYDGNVEFLGLKHIFLFIIAAICLLVTLFLVFCLLFIQCLQKISNLRCLHWVERMRPFFEAYTGPCNDNYRFWPGLLYLIRTILYAVSMYFGGDEVHWRHLRMIAVSTFCVLVMSLACIFPQGVYKKWPLNVLEFSFFLNLCILCVSLGLSNNSSGKIHYDISITLAMITTFGILIYHVYRRIKETRLLLKVKRCLLVCIWKTVKRKYFKINAERDPLLTQPLPTVVKFREPLLED